MAFNYSGSLAATGSTIGYRIAEGCNIALSGTWVGSVAVEALPDGGTAVERSSISVRCPTLSWGVRRRRALGVATTGSILSRAWAAAPAADHRPGARGLPRDPEASPAHR